MDKKTKLELVIKELTRKIGEQYPHLAPCLTFLPFGYISHRLFKKQHDIVKCVWKEKGDYLQVHISWLEKEQKEWIASEFVKLLDRYMLTCVTNINGEHRANGDTILSEKLLSLIIAYTATGRPENMLKYRYVPLLNNSDPRISLKGNGYALRELRTVEEIEALKVTQGTTSVEMKELRRQVYEKMKAAFPDLSYEDEKRYRVDGVELIVRIREVAADGDVVIRHRVGDEKWDQGQLMDADTIANEAIRQIKNKRLALLFS
jgi:hypothetical protein